MACFTSSTVPSSGAPQSWVCRVSSPRWPECFPTCQPGWAPPCRSGWGTWCSPRGSRTPPGGGRSWRQSGTLSLVQISRDTALSLVEIHARKGSMCQQYTVIPHITESFCDHHDLKQWESSILMSLDQWEVSTLPVVVVWGVHVHPGEEESLQGHLVPGGGGIQDLHEARLFVNFQILKYFPWTHNKRLKAPSSFSS